MKLKDIALWTFRQENLKNIRWVINTCHYSPSSFGYMDSVAPLPPLQEQERTNYLTLEYNPSESYYEYDTEHKIVLDLNNDILIENNYILVHFTKPTDYETARTIDEFNLIVSPYYKLSGCVISLFDNNSNKYLNCLRHTFDYIINPKPIKNTAKTIEEKIEDVIDELCEAERKRLTKIFHKRLKK